MNRYANEFTQRFTVRRASRVFGFCVCLLLFLKCPASLVGAEIPIINSSFEEPATDNWVNGAAGWQTTGQAGVYTTAPSLGMTAPDGKQVGFIDGYGVVQSFTQVLPATLEPNTAYTLSIMVGGRRDGVNNPGKQYEVSLLAGTEILTSVAPVEPPSGAWITLEARYSSGGLIPPNEPLAIRIASSATEFNFDNVKLTAFAITPIGCAQRPDDLIAWWTGDDTAIDKTGLNLDARLLYGASYGSGIVGRAFQFDGGESYASFGDLSLLQNTDGLTISVWVNKMDNNNPYAGILGKWTGNSTDTTLDFLLYNGEDNRNAGAFAIRTGESQISILNGATPITPGRWTHILALWRRSDGLMQLYKNGRLDGEAYAPPGQPLHFSPGLNATLGQWAEIGGYDWRYRFKGMVDEVMIFRRALLSQEVMEIYRAGTYGNGICVDPIPVIQSVTPTSGPHSGGTVVSIRGSHFQPTSSVFFGTNRAASTIYYDETRLDALTRPSQSGTVDIRVQNADGQRGSKPAAFEFKDLSLPPAIGLSQREDTILLHWLGSIDQFALEQSTTLTEWHSAPYVQEFLDGRISVRISSASSSQSFFRLRKIYEFALVPEFPQGGGWDNIAKIISMDERVPKGASQIRTPVGNYRLLMALSGNDEILLLGYPTPFGYAKLDPESTALALSVIGVNPAGFGKLEESELQEIRNLPTFERLLEAVERNFLGSVPLEQDSSITLLALDVAKEFADSKKPSHLSASRQLIIADTSWDVEYGALPFHFVDNRPLFVEAVWIERKPLVNSSEIPGVVVYNTTPMFWEAISRDALGKPIAETPINSLPFDFWSFLPGRGSPTKIELPGDQARFTVTLHQSDLTKFKNTVSFVMRLFAALLSQVTVVGDNQIELTDCMAKICDEIVKQHLPNVGAQSNGQSVKDYILANIPSDLSVYIETAINCSGSARGVKYKNLGEALGKLQNLWKQFEFARSAVELTGLTAHLIQNWNFHETVDINVVHHLELSPQVKPLKPQEAFFCSVRAKDSANNTIPRKPEQFAWRSSDESLLTVSNEVVRSRSFRDATAHVIVRDTVTLKESDFPIELQGVDHIDLAAREFYLAKGASLKIEVNALTSKGEKIQLPDTDFSWDVQPPSVAVYIGGRIRGLKAGNAVITVTEPHSGKSNFAYLEVTALKRMDIIPSLLLVRVGDIVSLDVRAVDTRDALVPRDALDLRWESDSRSIATIDPLTGVLRAISKGSSRVSVKDLPSGVIAAVDVLIIDQAPPVLSGTIGASAITERIPTLENSTWHGQFVIPEFAISLFRGQYIFTEQYPFGGTHYNAGNYGMRLNSGAFEYLATYNLGESLNYRTEQAQQMTIVFNWQPGQRDYTGVIDIRYLWSNGGGAPREWYKKFDFRGTAEVDENGVTLDLNKIPALDVGGYAASTTMLKLSGRLRGEFAP